MGSVRNVLQVTAEVEEEGCDVFGTGCVFWVFMGSRQTTKWIE